MGRNQHFIPKMMSRNFASTDGTLAELIKPSLQLATRRRRPKGIFFREHVYEDALGSFDDEYLKGIEQRFAEHYPSVVKEPVRSLSKNLGAGTALIDWVASMFARTEYVTQHSRQVLASWNKGDAIATAIADNAIRTTMYIRWRVLLTGSEWAWKSCRMNGADELVLTDNPVCTVRLSDSREVVLVPLSSRVILYAAHRDSIHSCLAWKCRMVNLVLAAWANSRILAAKQQTLLTLASDLAGTGLSLDASWLLEARKPFFGTLERAKLIPPASSPETHTNDAELFRRYGAIAPNGFPA